jgi:hypothetical protein
MVLYAILSYSDRYVQRSRRWTASAPTWLRHIGRVRHVVWVWAGKARGVVEVREGARGREQCLMSGAVGQEGRARAVVVSCPPLRVCGRFWRRFACTG